MRQCQTLVLLLSMVKCITGTVHDNIMHDILLVGEAVDSGYSNSASHIFFHVVK